MPVSYPHVNHLIQRPELCGTVFPWSWPTDRLTTKFSYSVLECWIRFSDTHRGGWRNLQWTPREGGKAIHSHWGGSPQAISCPQERSSYHRLSLKWNQLPILKILESFHKYPNFMLPLKHWKIWQHWVHAPAQKQLGWAWAVTICLHTGMNHHSKVTFTTSPALCSQHLPHIQYRNTKMSPGFPFQLSEDNYLVLSSSVWYL